jgi:autotransporter-associated beta strand protein
VANGATKYWDGAGTWTDANSWSLTSGGPYNQSWAASDDAVFDVAGAITAATTTFKSITVNQNVTWTAGGTLTAASPGTVTVAAGKTLNTAAQGWASSSRFIKDGPGLWVTQGGTYTGNFTMNAGTIAMASGNALGGTSGSRTLTLNGGQIRSNSSVARDLDTRFGGGIIIGGAITLGAASPAEGAMSFGNNVTLGAATRQITTDGTVTLSGIISGSAGAGLTKAGVGLLTLSGENTYSGDTTVNAGTLRLGAGGTVGKLHTNSVVSISNNATFVINRSDTVTQGTDFTGSAISGAGGFTQAGSGTTVFNAANTYTGATTVAAGTLRLTRTDALAAGTDVTLATDATIDLDFDGALTIRSLKVGDTLKYKGLHGASTLPGRLTGRGYLRTTEGPGRGTLIKVY